MFETTEDHIDRDSSKKLYRQLFDILKGKLERGEWSVGTQIPTEEELCRAYEVSKATVRQAISDLVRQGFLKRQQGKGTFVCRRVIPEGLTMLTSFREIMLEAGLKFSTRLLARTMTMMTDDLSLKLQVPENRHLLYLKRVRSVAGEPLLLQETWLPYTLCPQLLDANLERESLLEVLEKRCRVRIVRVRDWIGVETANAEEAEALGLATGAPCLLLEQFFYAPEGQVMYTRSLKNPERFRLVIDLERKA
jgi:DNA-binding GntR family transcriptional regulator